MSAHASSEPIFLIKLGMTSCCSFEIILCRMKVGLSFGLWQRNSADDNGLVEWLRGANSLDTNDTSVRLMGDSVDKGGSGIGSRLVCDCILLVPLSVTSAADVVWFKSVMFFIKRLERWSSWRNSMAASSNGGTISTPSSLRAAAAGENMSSNKWSLCGSLETTKLLRFGNNFVAWKLLSWWSKINNLNVCWKKCNLVVVKTN